MSEETANWVQAQNKVTFDYLANIPYRDELKNRLEQLWNYEKVSAPFTEGNYQYFYKNCISCLFSTLLSNIIKVIYVLCI